MSNQALINYAIAQGDDALVLGQRLSQWCASAPFLEEDLAISNVALDFIGRAQMFYEYAATLEGGKRTADDIAFMRDTRDFRNLLIFELPNGDFAFSMARQLIIDLFNVDYVNALTHSSDDTIAAIAKKSIKESLYHLRRSRDWVIRLGDGTEESHNRIQAAFDNLWGYLDELFVMTADEATLANQGIAVDKSLLRASFEQQLANVLQEATVAQPASTWKVSGGRDGIHTEHHGHMLAEMQFLQRAYPGLEW